MRIWSLHPQYIDAKGLVALWRETLLAKHVLEGKKRDIKITHNSIDLKKQRNLSMRQINIYQKYMQKQHTETTTLTKKK